MVRIKRTLVKVGNKLERTRRHAFRSAVVTAFLVVLSRTEISNGLKKVV